MLMVRVGLRAQARRALLGLAVAGFGTITPAAAQQSPEGFRGIGPLGGFATVAPEHVVDAAMSCARVVDGSRIDAARLQAIGWYRVAPEDAVESGESTMHFDFYQRPNGRVQLRVGKTGEAATACWMSAVIGSIANGDRVKALISAKLGPGRADAPNRVGLTGATGWTTATASVLFRAVTLERGGAASAHLVVLPRSGDLESDPEPGLRKKIIS